MVWLPEEEESEEQIQQVRDNAVARIIAFSEQRIKAERQQIITEWLKSGKESNALKKKLDNRTISLIRQAMDNAQKAMQAATALSWSKTRKLVWERDQGVCQVCGDEIEWKYYECGHIIDRVVGGSDRLSNLVVMCITCNRLKPLTPTREEYIAWAETGGPIHEAMKMTWIQLKEKEAAKLATSHVVTDQTLPHHT